MGPRSAPQPARAMPARGSAFHGGSCSSKYQIAAVARIRLRDLLNQGSVLLILILAGGAADQRGKGLPLPFADLLVRPPFLAKRKTRKGIERPTNAAAICGVVVPPIDAHPLPPR